jgi:hypothetical protein
MKQQPSLKRKLKKKNKFLILLILTGLSSLTCCFKQEPPLGAGQPFAFLFFLKTSKQTV